MSLKETGTRHRRGISTLRVRVKRARPDLSTAKTQKSQSRKAECSSGLLSRVQLKTSCTADTVPALSSNRLVEAET